MGFRFSVLLTASLMMGAALPVTAAEFERSGAWVFNSVAVAAEGETMIYACAASTESADGTTLTLLLEPAVGGAVDAGMTVSNKAWALDDGPLRVGFDIGGRNWMLPGEGAGQTAEVSWTGDAALLTFLEGLASASAAGLTGRDGAAISQFSLSGSRSAIEAMKVCVEEQIDGGLGTVFEARAADASNPF